MITFDSVTKTYPSGSTVLEDFSLECIQGATTVLLGASGCGKTTLLRMVNRMIDPTKGRIVVNGRDVAEVNPVRLRRSIGYVLQHGGLLPHRTVLTNAALAARLTGMTKQEARTVAARFLTDMGLDESLFSRYPSQLSGGQRQRVGVARALATGSDILLMDEPFGALDPLVRKELQEQICHLQRRLGKTILFVTHDVDEAFMLADEVVLLREGGVIVQRATPTQMIAEPASNYVRQFIGLDRSRMLHVEEREGAHVVLTPTGHPLGLIEPCDEHDVQGNNKSPEEHDPNEKQAQFHGGNHADPVGAHDEGLGGAQDNDQSGGE
ncbi:ABC transporter ATP-binding protein [Actinomyces vulturis]|uniref:ABC transporter ATP-binding protein n=1 Tax=Actinomyces vulturis TaxID=1857645 RepID=UPI000832643E|nr:ATP-binding cassette domain-containing protein [Actinomyces vulturis]